MMLALGEILQGEGRLDLQTSADSYRSHLVQVMMVERYHNNCMVDMAKTVAVVAIFMISNYANKCSSYHYSYYFSSSSYYYYYYYYHYYYYYYYYYYYTQCPSSKLARSMTDTYDTVG